MPAPLLAALAVGARAIAPTVARSVATSAITSALTPSRSSEFESGKREN